MFHADELEKLDANNVGFLSRPVHLLVESGSERRLVRDTRCHTAPKNISSRYILQMPNGVFVESSELCLLHMANVLSFPRFVELSYEFCGGYRIRPDDQEGFVECDPLTSHAKLLRSARSFKRAWGIRPFLRMLTYIRNGSRSPMETIIVLLLCLPPRLGGYGIPLPQLNYRVNVPRDNRKTSLNHYYVCDAFWPDAWLDVEYDSDLAHTGSVRIAKDARRRNGLASLGVTVITITRIQVFNCDEMDRIAHVIAKKLGHRLRQQGSEWVKARANLRSEFLQFSNKR